MPISFSAALGSHEQALQLRAERMKVLASNIANAETPGYKAKDFNFADALKQATGKQTTGNGVRMQTTQAGHMAAQGTTGMGAEMQYRVPMQPTIDGNSVDIQIERAKFSENAVAYQTTLKFLNGKFIGMKAALKGE